MSVNVEYIDQLDRLSKVEFDIALFEYLKKKEREYIKRGASFSLIESLTFFISQTEKITKSKCSTAFGLLLKFLSKLLLESGQEFTTLTRALKLIETSISILNMSNISKLGLLDELVSAHLLRGVIYKILNNKDESQYSLKWAKHHLYYDYRLSSKDLIKLTRQEQINLQTPASHQKMLRDAASVKYLNPIEYYGSIKRVFEFHMNNSINVSKLEPIFLEAFANVRFRLPQISKVSFMKNMGQKLLLDNCKKRAIAILRVALAKAELLELNAQMKQISALLESVNSSSHTLKSNILVKY